MGVVHAPRRFRQRSNGTCSTATSARGQQSWYTSASDGLPGFGGRLPWLAVDQPEFPQFLHGLGDGALIAMPQYHISLSRPGWLLVPSLLA